MLRPADLDGISRLVLDYHARVRVPDGMVVDPDFLDIDSTSMITNEEGSFSISVFEAHIYGKLQARDGLVIGQKSTSRQSTNAAEAIAARSLVGPDAGSPDS